MNAIPTKPKIAIPTANQPARGDTVRLYTELDWPIPCNL